MELSNLATELLNNMLESKEFAVKAMAGLFQNENSEFSYGEQVHIAEQAAYAWLECAVYITGLSYIDDKFNRCLAHHQDTAIKLIDLKPHNIWLMKQLASNWDSCAVMLTAHQSSDVRYECAEACTEAAKLLINDKDADVRYTVAKYPEHAPNLIEDKDLLVRRMAKRVVANTTNPMPA